MDDGGVAELGERTVPTVPTILARKRVA